jgi:TetR/AcrR family transcriptional repressor of nem operon
MSEALKTRDKIVGAARDLFLMRGYNATGLSEITKRAGVNPGSLYYFFPTKEDLLLAVLEWYRVNIGPGLLDPVFERLSDPFERIFGLLDGYRQVLLLTNFEHGCPIGNLALEVSNSHPSVLPLLQANFDNWVQAIESCLAQMGDRLPSDIDRAQLALLVLNTMEGGMMLSRTYRSIEPFDRSIAQLRDYFERLV